MIVTDSLNVSPGLKVCQQAYYNRAWARAEKHQRLDEEVSTDIRPGQRLQDGHSIKTESDFASTMGKYF